MSNWISTNELRFVERVVPDGLGEKTIKFVHILQQKWQANVYDTEANDYVHEWRDVPIVEEN